MNFPGFVARCVPVTASIAAISCLADVLPAPPFTDHAVLQRDAVVPVWGRAAAGERIAVSHRGQRLETTAGADGRWSVQLAPMPAASEGSDLVISGITTVTLRDVVVGEVWLASGQSNMEWPLRLARDGQREVAAANSPLIRQLRVEHSPSDLPTDSVTTGGWQIATPETAGSFSAVGYFFARAMAERLRVPVGIINSSWGATPIESWLPESELRKSGAWPGFSKNWQRALKEFPRKMAEYPELDLAWRKADEEQHATGKPNTLPWPHPPVGPGTAFAPGALFNGMVLPLVPFALRGVLWYQGEANVGREGEYRELFLAMVHSWRSAWPLGDFPFYFVQLPNFADGDAGGRRWAALRDAQSAALRLPRTGMVVTLDVGEAGNLHPTNKQPVGERLALIALANVHGSTEESSGPVLHSATRENGSVRLRFDHARNLAADSDAPNGFELAGPDLVFLPATARIEGDEVIAATPLVPNPVAVRYAWTNSPLVSLCNGAKLPAVPFSSAVRPR